MNAQANPPATDRLQFVIADLISRRLLTVFLCELPFSVVTRYTVPFRGACLHAILKGWEAGWGAEGRRYPVLLVIFRIGMIYEAEWLPATIRTTPAFSH
jgi:hypothetical protein